MADLLILLSILASIFSSRDLLRFPLSLFLLVLGQGNLGAEPRDVRSCSRRLSGFSAGHQRFALLAWLCGSSENLAVGIRESNLAIGDGLQRRVVLNAVLLVPIFKPGASGSRGIELYLAVLVGLQIVFDPLCYVIQVLDLCGAGLMMLIELSLGHNVRVVVMALGELERPCSARVIFVGDDAFPAFDEVVSEGAGEAVVSWVVGVVGALL